MANHKGETTMKLLSPKVHGVIDYVSVILLAVSPSLFGLAGVAALVAYALAVIHLLMTVLTDFPLGMVRLVPLRLHGLVEIVVGIALVSLPWLLTRVVALGDRGRIFYTVFGAVLIAVFVATDYAAD
jgi:hypothetical protein